MSDFSPVGARSHVSRLGEGAPGAAGSTAGGTDPLFRSDDADFTRPVSIVARRKLGETDVSVFPFLLGTARLAAMDETAAGRILHRFTGRAGGFLDVVDEDGSGRSQEVVGAWLHAHRHDRIVTTLTPSPERDGGRATGGTRIIRSVEAALRRLRIERIDLLTLDLRGQDLTIDQRLGAVDELVSAGKVRHLGASGVTGEGLIEARVLAGDGLARIVAVRAPWDITTRPDAVEELRMVAAAQQLAILPDATTTTLALTRPSLPQKVLASRLRGPWAAAAARPAAREYERAADVLAGRGREHRIALALDRVSAELAVSPGTAQLAWLLAKRGVVAPIVQVTRPEQVDPLMDAAAVRLTRAQMLELDRATEALR